MSKLLKKLGLLFGVAIISFSYYSCETTELDKVVDPNALALPDADAGLLLNRAQTNFGRMVQEFGTAAAEVTRLKAMFGRNYNTAYRAAAFDRRWQRSYADVIKNIRVMNPIAQAKGLKRHLAIGQVIEAYTMMNLVDFFGDVPYTEAFVDANLKPKADSGASIYAAAITLLDQAIINFSGASIGSPADFYYGGSWTKWIKLANTLKMKAYIQTRLVDATAMPKFNAIVATGNYIGTGSGEDFDFNWSTSNANPDSRHPEYDRNYNPAGVRDGYQSNWLMDVMKNKKSVIDPRMRYYFYRQTNSVPVSEQNLRCSVEATPAHLTAFGATFCRITNDNGYWGRDHGNNEGIPPDTQLRTASGVYPAGGRFDGNNFQGIASVTVGARGAGITPILLASTVDFWRAEAALLPGGTGNARTLMLAGIQKSIAKVRAFVSRDATANLTFVPPASIDALYLADVATAYDAAPADLKLNVVVREFFITLFGQGIDAYNAYRRTGFPNDLQPNVEPNPSGFIRSFYYPASETGSNASIPQKANVQQRVFWDTNPVTGFLIPN